MWKRQASAAHGPRRDSGQETPTKTKRGDFPTLSSHLAPLLVRPSRTLQPWAPQLDPTTPCRSQTSPAPSPVQSRAPAPSAQIPALRIGRTRSPAAQGWIWTGITWGTLNIIKVGPHTDNMTKNLWSGGKNVSTKGFINLMSRMC